jgi:uncharacterized damage-inducible protein DinB
VRVSNVVAATLSLCVAMAQGNAQAAAGDPRTLLQAGFNEVSSFVAKSADMVPPDKYSYRPTASVRTFGQLVAHMADGYVWYCARATGRNVEWSDAIEQGPGDKATIVAKLKQAQSGCSSVYGGQGSFRALMENIAHTNLHYGNVITYLRMMGLTPPSS